MNDQFNVKLKLQPLHTDGELIKVKESVIGIGDLYVELNNESTDGQKKSRAV